MSLGRMILSKENEIRQSNEYVQTHVCVALETVKLISRMSVWTIDH
jgi:hypothetical protein